MLSWADILEIHALWAIPVAIMWSLYLLARRFESRGVRSLIYTLDAIAAVVILASLVHQWSSVERNVNPDDHIAGLGDLGLTGLFVMVGAIVLASAVWSAWATFQLGDGPEPRWLAQFDDGASH